MTMSKFITKTNYGNLQSGSLRTTIPKEIVEELQLSKGDSVKWILDKDDETDEIISVTVEKLDL